MRQSRPGLFKNVEDKVPSKHILPVARSDPEVVPMLTFELTASIALEKLAKLAGKKVVATCGGKDKAMLLIDLGVDRVIDYKEESIKNRHRVAISAELSPRILTSQQPPPPPTPPLALRYRSHAPVTPQISTTIPKAVNRIRR
ncbi:hypothetical protein L1887_29830 [Cichorium endivia]|nr:hypothetical protein L1887_29830 [Cichorium endivia]